MAIFAKLEMRQGQSLVMTPQLQQAIKLLQLSNQELAEFVEAELERNPLLVKVEGDATPAAEAVEAQRSDAREQGEAAAQTEARVQLDAPGEDVYEPGTGSDAAMPANASGTSATTDWSSAGSGQSSEDFDYTANLSSDVTLAEHLHMQLNFAGLSSADRLIAAGVAGESGR